MIESEKIFNKLTRETFKNKKRNEKREEQTKAILGEINCTID
jgi:hypothetical protein